MIIEDDIKRNGSGYVDHVASKAIQKVDRDDERFHKLLETIFNICELSGFHIEGRIVIKDKRSGRVWR